MREFAIELWMFMNERKKFWTLPIIIILAALSVMIVALQGSAIAPFIYPLF